MSTVTRWPRKPPKDARCDAMTGVTHDFTGQPQVVRCKAPAVETCISTAPSGLEAWLCEPCAVAIEKRGHVKRNPRRKRAK